MQIAQFRNKVKLYLQLADIPQKKLAEAIHMHPTVLSNKLGGTFRNAPFTYNQIKQIVKLLTEWQAINTQTEAVELLHLMDLNYNSFTPEEWSSFPLVKLEPFKPGDKFRQPDFSSNGSPVKASTTLTESEASEVTGYGMIKLEKGLDREIESFTLQRLPKHQNWPGAIQTGPVYGRQAELTRLVQWVTQEGCRVVAVLGIGGIGKTTLAAKLVERLVTEFDFVLWYSLHKAPPLDSLLSDILQFLTEETPLELPAGVDDKLRRLVENIQSLRVLLVLDNWESLLQGGEQTGSYRPGYEEYASLIEQIGQNHHQSCLVLTSREKSPELSFIEAKISNVRCLTLAGLEIGEAQLILSDLGLEANEENQAALVRRYSGNPLALKLVAEPIRVLFGGMVETFLKEEYSVFGEIEEIVAQQLKRLSKLEEQLIYWLVLAREPLSLTELSQNLIYPSSPKDIHQAIISLDRRNLLELEQEQSRFTLPAVVLEYLTGQIVEQIIKELSTGQFKLLQTHALLWAEAKGYVQASQRRFILSPILNRFQILWPDQGSMQEHLEKLLRQLQVQPRSQQGYSGGNLLNLLCLLKGNLNG